MNYPFPTIRTIDDVLPHIKGMDEFNVNGTVFILLGMYMMVITNLFRNHLNCH